MRIHKELHYDEMTGDYYFIHNGIRQKSINQEDTLLLIYILEMLKVKEIPI